jgi:streptogramin lyase
MVQVSELKERLDLELAQIGPAVDARAAIGERAEQRRRRRRLLLVPATLLFTATILAGLTYAFRAGLRPPGPAEEGSIRVPGEPVEAIAAGDALWVLTQEPGCDGPVCSGFVAKIDPRRGEVVEQIPMTSPQAAAAGAGSIWVASFADDTVVRLDPATAQIEATIPLTLPFEVVEGDDRFLPFDLDATDDAVWVSTGRGVVAHISPSTNDVVAMARLPEGTGGPVAIGETGVWVADGLNGAIRVDPETYRVSDAVRLDDEAGKRLSVNTLVARDGAIWVVGNWARPIGDLDGGGYVAGERHAVVEIDESDGSVASILDIRGGPAGLLEGDDVWVVESDDEYLRRIDVTARALSSAIPVPFGRPLVVSGSTAWSGVGESIRSWELPDGTARATATPSPTVTAAPERGTGPIRGAFYPAVHREGDRIVMPVTFVDGTTAEVIFRGDLGADELGTYGEIAGGLGDIDRSIYFRYGTASQFEGSGPLASYEGHGGSTVEEWEPPPDSFACPNLVFRFGDWFVGVRTCQDDLSSAEKAQWARLLVGHQTDDGFLVLDAEPPLTIAETGEHAGPDLWLQGQDRGWPFITLRPGPCTLGEPAKNQELRVMPDGQEVLIARIAGQIETWYANWCEDGMMYVGVDSRDRNYVEAAAEGLRIRDITLAS